jgi:type IV pilus assembly protein PilY1
MIDPVSKKRYVMVGTGRLLDDSDIGDTTRQSIYAFIDGDATTTSISTTLTRSDLEPNTAPTTGIGSAPTKTGGWYIDLTASTGTSDASERVNITPTVNNGVLGVGVNKPDANPCSPSGSSYLMALSFSTGKSALVNSTGTVIAKTPSVADSIVTDLTFKNIGGRIKLVTGGSDGSVSSVAGNYGGSGSLKRLNWRQVPVSD